MVAIRHLFCGNLEDASGCRGAVAVLVALMLTVLIGFAALGGEVVLLFSAARHMQAAADAAALAAVRAGMAGAGWPNQQQEAYAMTAVAGFLDGADGTAVTVNNPPASGHYTSDAGAVEVLIAQPRTVFLARVFHIAPFTLRARAVALVSDYGDCVLALAGSGSSTFSMTGSEIANLTNCGLAVDSNSATAVSLVGSPILSASQVRIVGGYSVVGSGSINATNGIVTGASAVANPYASYSVPTVGACQYNNYSATGGNVWPGVYCNGFSAVGSMSVVMQPGVYIIDRGSFSLTGSLSLTGTNVTIVLTSSTGADYATASITGSETVNLTAPTTGATAGLVFFQDPRAPLGGSDSLTGSGGQTFTGAVYFPSQNLTITGSSSLTSQCTQIIAQKITLTGSATLTDNCAGTGALPIAGGATLAE